MIIRSGKPNLFGVLARRGRKIEEFLLDFVANNKVEIDKIIEILKSHYFITKENIEQIYEIISSIKYEEKELINRNQTPKAGTTTVKNTSNTEVLQKKSKLYTEKAKNASRKVRKKTTTRKNEVVKK